MARRRKPDHEAVEVGIEADRITDPRYFPKSGTDGANRVIAKGDVEITVRKQHPGSRDKRTRPDPGTVIKVEGGGSKVTIESRRINKVRRGSRRASTTASGMVEIFRNRRSRREVRRTARRSIASYSCGKT